MISAASLNATSSPVSAGGLSLSEWQASPTTDHFGRPRAHASPSARQAKALGLLTSGTSGPRSTISLSSAALIWSLASRLQARTPSNGSILFTLTWRQRDTPLGYPIFALRASARPTSDNAFTGWRTPNTVDSAGGTRSPGSPGQVQLCHQAHLAAWATTTAGDSKRGASRRTDYDAPQSQLTTQIRALASWPTTTTTDAVRMPGENFTTPNITLNHAASYLAGWPTAAARDYRSANLKSFEERGGGAKGEQLNNAVVHFGPVLSGSSAPTGKRAQLNPAFSLWLMGFQIAWALCVARVMPSSRRSRKSSSKPTLRITNDVR